MIDVRRISSVLEAPFDSEDTTASCIADIVCATGPCESRAVICLCGDIAERRDAAVGCLSSRDAGAAVLLTAMRQWLDQLLFLWISPSSSRSKTSSWLRLQLAAMEGMIGILSMNVKHAGPQGHFVETSVGNFISRSPECDSSTSSLADEYGAHTTFYPFRHWCDGFVAMMEKELMLLSAELRTHRGTPERTSVNSPPQNTTTVTTALLRVEAIATLLAEMSTSIPMLHERVLGSVSTCRQVARFLAAIEPWLQGPVGLKAPPGNGPLAIQSVQRLMVWWCRATQAFPHLAKLGHIQVGLSGGLGQRLSRLSCLDARSSGIGDVAASLLATLLLHSEALFQEGHASDSHPTDTEVVASHVAWMRMVGARAIADGSADDDGVWTVYLRQQWMRLCGLAIGRAAAFHRQQQTPDAADGNGRRCVWCCEDPPSLESPSPPLGICSDLVALMRMTGFFLVESSIALSDEQDTSSSAQREHSAAGVRGRLIELWNGAVSSTLSFHRAAQPAIAHGFKRIRLLHHLELFVSSTFQNCSRAGWESAATTWPLCEVPATLHAVANAIVSVATCVLRTHLADLGPQTDARQQEFDILVRLLDVAPLDVDQVGSITDTLCFCCTTTTAADSITAHRRERSEGVDDAVSCATADVLTICSLLKKKLQ